MSRFRADDIVWHVGGDHPFSGDYRGRAEVVEYFRSVQEVTAGTLDLEVEEVLADDRHGAVVPRAVGRRGERTLDVTLAEAWRFDEDGRWVESWALANDRGALEAFFT